MLKLPALLGLVALETACVVRVRPPVPARPGVVMHVPRPPVPLMSIGEAAGIRFVEIVPVGASASEPLPLLVGIHGYNGSPQKFIGALSSLRLRARVILPYGFFPTRDGFSWWDIRVVDEARLADDTQRGADGLAAMIDEIRRRRPTVGKAIVTGFSQGGVMSFTLAVLHPEVVRAAFPISGFLARPLWPTAWPPGVPKPILHAFHGTADPLVPIDAARGTVQRLAEIGLVADLVEYPGLGHAGSLAERRDLAWAIQQVVALP